MIVCIINLSSVVVSGIKINPDGNPGSSIPFDLVPQGIRRRDDLSSLDAIAVPVIKSGATLPHGTPVREPGELTVTWVDEGTLSVAILMDAGHPIE